MLEGGCDGYVSKPIDIRKFLKTLSEYLLQEDARYE
jgi:CheY-like chemotaxis protein